MGTERRRERAEHFRSHNDRMKIVRFGKSDSLVLHHIHTHTCTHARLQGRRCIFMRTFPYMHLNVANNEKLEAIMRTNVRTVDATAPTEKCVYKIEGNSATKEKPKENANQQQVQRRVKGRHRE